jgi:hypothetical protein
MLQTYLIFYSYVDISNYIAMIIALFISNLLNPFIIKKSYLFNLRFFYNKNQINVTLICILCN